MTLRILAKKEKTQTGFHQNNLVLQRIHQENENIAQKWERIFISIFVKGLVCRIYEEILKVSNKKATSSIKMGKGY